MIWRRLVCGLIGHRDAASRYAVIGGVPLTGDFCPRCLTVFAVRRGDRAARRRAQFHR